MAGPSSTHDKVRLEQEIRKSTTRSVQLLSKALQVGIKTNEELERQAESLERTETKLDEVKQNLRSSSRMLNVIESPIRALFSGSSRMKPYDVAKAKHPKKTASKEPSDRKLRSGSSSLHTTSSNSSSSTGDVVVDQNLDEMSKIVQQLGGQAELISQQLDDSNQQIKRVKGKTVKNDITLKKLNKILEKELQ